MDVDEGAGTANNVTGGTFYGPVLQAGSMSIRNLNVVPRQRPRPNQLPVLGRGSVFVNRTAELRELWRLAADTGTGAEGPVIVNVSGLGGAGKTKLVAYWASQEQGFTDGRLYYDLADVRHDGGVDPGAVLLKWLRDLGADENETGGSPGERAANFRTFTAGRRVLVFIDNAQHVAEVRSLLPASGVVVVTSRRPLRELVTDGAEFVALEPFSPEAGAELFRVFLDEERGAHPAVAELVRLCAGLPLALGAVGSRLLERPEQSMADVVAELTDEQRRLEVMDGEDAAVSAALDAAYECLPERACEALALAGLFPGTTFTRELLEEAGLLRPEDALAPLLASQSATVTDGRYRLHDLVRVHARVRAAARFSAPERARVLGAFVDFYRERVAAADSAVLGPRYRISPLPGRTWFADSATALEWLDAERSNILEVLRAAHESGRHDDVWRMCESLWALYHSRKYVGDWIASHRLGIEAAQWEARPDAEIRLRNQLARAYMETGQHQQAEQELRRATQLLGLVEKPQLPGMIWETEGLLLLAREDPTDDELARAVRLFTDACDANEQAEDAHGVTVQSYNLGQALLRAGRPEDAERVLLEALARAVRTHDDPMRSRVGIVLGHVQRALGNVEEALRQTVNAAHWADRLGQRAKLKQALASLQELTGEFEDAEQGEAWQRRIRALRRDLGDLGADDGQS